ncbi:hypothetical protein NDU88_002590 [Pleurodeles waltl]|uniref:Uncharacterized protein n=1 Tax=Pleurodeles waltl TaxID=8319 RepID=A0AAV7M4L2_PLEWA|nr:hypothetical protein NDU88_002590 [Pleurodeles waltl]
MEMYMVGLEEGDNLSAESPTGSRADLDEVPIAELLHQINSTHKKEEGVEAEQIVDAPKFPAQDHNQDRTYEEIEGFCFKRRKFEDDEEGG